MRQVRFMYGWCGFWRRLPSRQYPAKYLYQHYIQNPKYRGMFVTYLGKPLMLYYLNGPRTGSPPKLQDDRFTIRYVGAWLQTTHQEESGVWSWYDQSPVPTFYQGKAEALTVTNGYPSPIVVRPVWIIGLLRTLGARITVRRIARSGRSPCVRNRAFSLLINGTNSFLRTSTTRT
jgi:hypothetical protein